MKEEMKTKKSIYSKNDPSFSDAENHCQEESKWRNLMDDIFRITISVFYINQLLNKY